MASTSQDSTQKETMASTEKVLGPQEAEQVEGTVRLFDSQGQVRKIPIPSNDPSDPLTWSLWKRSLVLLCICVFGITGFGLIQTTLLFFPEIIPEYKRQTRGVRDDTQ
jgi:hypothetical protein